MNDHDFSPQLTSVFTVGLIRAATLVSLVILLHNNLRLPAALTLFILIATEGARWWSRAGLRNLQAERRIRPLRLFPGEEVRLSVKIFNNKLLPIICNWSQPIVRELEVVDPGEGPAELQNVLSGAGVLKSHATFTVERSLRARGRGYYRLPPILIFSRDGLGLYSHQVSMDEDKWVVVYPRLVSLPELGLNPSDLIGDRPDKRYILPDPIRVAGLQEYTPNMPARLIHWKASAHKNRLLARVLEPSSDLILCIAVDAEAFVLEPSRAEAFETALSVAASLACWADSQGIPFGLLVNATQTGLTGPVVIPVSGGPGQASLVLESLARLELNPLLPLAELLRAQCLRLPWGTTLFYMGAATVCEVPPGVRHVVLHRCEDFEHPGISDQLSTDRLPEIREG